MTTTARAIISSGLWFVSDEHPLSPLADAAASEKRLKTSYYRESQQLFIALDPRPRPAICLRVRTIELLYCSNLDKTKRISLTLPLSLPAKSAFEFTAIGV